MAEVKHTPGPWMAAASPSSIVGWPVVAQSGRLICSLATLPKQIDRIGKEIERYDAFMAEVGANGHLIGAAPDLLEALRECQAALAMMVAPNSIEQTTVVNAFAAATAADAKARSAIGKAEGRS